MKSVDSKAVHDRKWRHGVEDHGWSLAEKISALQPKNPKVEQATLPSNPLVLQPREVPLPGCISLDLTKIKDHQLYALGLDKQNQGSPQSGLKAAKRPSRDWVNRFGASEIEPRVSPLKPPQALTLWGKGDCAVVRSLILCLMRYLGPLRRLGINPRKLGTNPRSKGTNPRALQHRHLVNLIMYYSASDAHPDSTISP